MEAFSEEPGPLQEQQAAESSENVYEEFESPSPQEDLISLVMQATALPQNSETQFLAITGKMPIKSYERPPQVINLLDGFLQKVLKSTELQQQLFISMLNQGNFIEIECELQRQLEDGYQQDHYVKWQKLAQAIVQIRTDQYFSFKRLYINQFPFVQRGPLGLRASIDEVKQRILSQDGVPEGISVNDISWDTISYKIPPMGIEYFAQLNPQIIDQLNENSVALINQLQIKIAEIIKIALAESRENTQTRPDALVSDYTILLESIIAADENPRRQHLVRNTGDAVLVQYLNSMYPLFTAGIIPGSILPGKISACQDIVTMTELRGAIQYLAQEQIIQKADVINQPNVKSAMEFGANESDLRERWSIKQSSSIRQAQNIDRGLATGLKSFTNLQYNDQTELKNQIAGGSNDLRQSLQLNQQGAIVKLNYEQTELLRQQLSILLACLRIRFDATQSSKTDMVSQEDIDHFTICEQLAQYLDPNTQRVIYELSQVIREMILSGHNQIKMSSMVPPKETQENVEYRVEGYSETTIKAIPFFEADLNEGRKYFKQLLDCIYISLADHNRVELERQQRYQRRKAIFDSFVIQLQ